MMTSHKSAGIIHIRRSQDRGHADHGWLKSHFTFSFADYHDPKFMGYRFLRVINEDWVDPRRGFDMHPHRDMEIFTYVIQGELTHQDSMGHTSTLKKGFVQKITAGTGILHSEFNNSEKTRVHLLQIWILPKQHGLKPAYEEHALPVIDEKIPLTLIGSPQGGARIVKFNQDIYIYRGVFKASEECEYQFSTGRGVWIQLISGKLHVLGHDLQAGDGASIESHEVFSIKAREHSEFLLFDMA